MTTIAILDSFKVDEQQYTVYMSLRSRPERYGLTGTDSELLNHLSHALKGKLP
jgi:hypothetical protein